MKATTQVRTHPRSGPPTARGGIKIHDILYVLFKHKWKILIPSFLGFAAAGALTYKHLSSPSYESQAKLLVRYVVQRNMDDPDTPSIRTSARPEAVMNAELEILQSFDIALDAAEKIQELNLLEEPEEELPEPVEYASSIASRFKAQSTRFSNVIQLSYRDSDPPKAVQVLNQLIQSYFERHLLIHRSTKALKEVEAQADLARSALRETESAINTLKGEYGVISIEGTYAEYESRRQLVRGSLMAAQAAQAEQRAKVAALVGSSPADSPDGSGADVGSVAAAEPPADPLADRERRQTAEAIAEYQDLTARLALLRQERNQLLLRRPATDPMVASLERQITSVQANSMDLAERHPAVVSRVQTPGQPAAMLMGPVPTIEDERALLMALEARVAELGKQVKTVDAQVGGISKLGFDLADLERLRQMQEEKYRYLQSSVEKAKVDRELNPTDIPNISIVQSPSAPAKSIDPGAFKLIVALAGSGLVLGLGLAFLFEWVLDRRVSRPTEIRTRLQLPLMMTIPFLRGKNGVERLDGPGSNGWLLEDSDDPLSPPPLPDRQALALKNGKSRLTRQKEEAEHFIMPFATAIHDRIIFNFEINNITHKPKLVALTGLSSGAGASTIAAGLAKAFSDHCKVLLVDLNPPQDSTQLLHGHPAAALRNALEVSRGEKFRHSRKNLYFASVPTRRNGRDSSALAPIGLHEIMPQLIASDYDYILFDMPPVDATSPTLAMAGFMDKVLLVLDAEATTPENLDWAYTELERGRADVSCIFNKAKSHAPRWVAGDL